MSTALLALVLSGLVVAAAGPWHVGVRARLRALARTCGSPGPDEAPAGSGGRQGTPAGSGRGSPVGRHGGPGAPGGVGADDRPLPAVGTAAVLDLLDAAIGAGASLPGALEAVGRALGGADGAVLVRAGTALLLGAPWDAAWQDAPDALRPVAQALGPAWSTGAAPGPSLRAQAAQLRRGRRTDAREAAGRLGVRLVLPLGLCLLPAFMLLGLVPVVLSLAGGLLD